MQVKQREDGFFRTPHAIHGAPTSDLGKFWKYLRRRWKPRQFIPDKNPGLCSPFFCLIGVRKGKVADYSVQYSRIFGLVSQVGKADAPFGRR